MGAFSQSGINWDGDIPAQFSVVNRDIPARVSDVSRDIATPNRVS